jgi:hypothetical protein
VDLVILNTALTKEWQCGIWGTKLDPVISNVVRNLVLQHTVSPFFQVLQDRVTQAGEKGDGRSEKGEREKGVTMG